MWQKSLISSAKSWEVQNIFSDGLLLIVLFRVVNHRRYRNFAVVIVVIVLTLRWFLCANNGRLCPLACVGWISLQHWIILNDRCHAMITLFTSLIGNIIVSFRVRVPYYWIYVFHLASCRKLEWIYKHLVSELSTVFYHLCGRFVWL